jgi:hypothetical protein
MEAQKSKPSGLLNPKDNHLVFGLLGDRVQSLSTAVIQFFVSSPPLSASRTGWDYVVTGVVCLSKDSLRRSYFIQIFDLDHKQQIWEQELYHEMLFNRNTPQVYSFEAEAGMAALSFADEREAVSFNTEVQARLERFRQPQVQIRHSKRQAAATPGLALDQGPGANPTIVHEINLDNARKNRTRPPTKPVDLGKLSGGPLAWGTWGRKNSSNLVPKVSKADIGAPTNFVHLKGVQSSTDGFQMVDNTREIDPGLRKLFEMAGISESILQDPTKRDEVGTFITQNAGKLRRLSKRPPPSRGAIPPPSRRVEPGPPSRSLAPPQWSATPRDHSPAKRTTGHPPRPPPIASRPPSRPTQTGTTGAPPPPPPPPPPAPPLLVSGSGDLPNPKPKMESDPRSDLLTQIHGGSNLRKAPDPDDRSLTSKPKLAPDPRSNLLKQIQDGGKLRHVTDTEKGPDQPVDGSLRNVLQSALDNIYMANQSSSDEDDRNFDSNDDEWEDD